MAQAETIFERQGVKLSEGLTRMVRLLVEAPEDAVPLMLGQAHGSAAVTLALEVLRRAGMPIPQQSKPQEDEAETVPRGGEGKPVRMPKVRDLRKS